MTQPMLASIERTCPRCGTSNRILTTEIKPNWQINCSRCGGAIAERRAFLPTARSTEPPAEERKSG